MLPSIEDGDVLYVAPATNARLRIGDIVFFKKDGEFKAHRIVGKDKNKNKECFITRGDASMNTDRPIRGGLFFSLLFAILPTDVQVVQ